MYDNRKLNRKWGNTLGLQPVFYFSSKSVKNNIDSGVRVWHGHFFYDCREKQREKRNRRNGKKI